MADTTSVIKFYNAFGQKLLTDYVGGNPRMLAAIRHTLQAIPLDARHILDIGCGIGWSSWEIKRHFPKASVVGVDISTELIQIAQTLFGTSGLAFIAQDVTEEGSLPASCFDAIVLLDVYEHIPQADRAVFHRMMNRVLKDQGVIVLTCPSIFHQDFLRTHKPEGLQPVDEDVTLANLLHLADDIEGEVVSFGYQTIWRTNDYTHTVIQKKPLYKEPDKHSRAKRTVSLETDRVRARRVKSQLRIDIPVRRKQSLPVRLVRGAGRRIKHAASTAMRRSW